MVEIITYIDNSFGLPKVLLPYSPAVLVSLSPGEMFHIFRLERLTLVWPSHSLAQTESQPSLCLLDMTDKSACQQVPGLKPHKHLRKKRRNLKNVNHLRPSLPYKNTPPLSYLV